MDKSHWKQYSSITFENKTLYINTGSESWALFVDGEFVQEGHEDPPEEFKDLWEEFWKED